MIHAFAHGVFQVQKWLSVNLTYIDAAAFSDALYICHDMTLPHLKDYVIYIPSRIPPPKWFFPISPPLHPTELRNSVRSELAALRTSFTCDFRPHSSLKGFVKNVILMASQQSELHTMKTREYDKLDAISSYWVITHFSCLYLQWKQPMTSCKQRKRLYICTNGYLWGSSCFEPDLQGKMKIRFILATRAT